MLSFVLYRSAKRYNQENNKQQYDIHICKRSTYLTLFAGINNIKFPILFKPKCLQKTPHKRNAVEILVK